MIAEFILGLLPFPAAAWHGHTERSRHDAITIRRAAARIGWSEKELAAFLGITQPQLSRQLAGLDPLNHWRIAELPDHFHEAYDAIKAERRIERDLIQLIRAMDATPRPALKVERRVVTLPLGQQKAKTG